jgi:hypothetical protein
MMGIGIGVTLLLVVFIIWRWIEDARKSKKYSDLEKRCYNTSKMARKS